LVAIRGNELMKLDVKSLKGRRRSPPRGDVHFLVVDENGDVELIKALPPTRRTLPMHERRPLGRRAGKRSTPSWHRIGTQSAASS
jgi:hypothetical protein